MAYFCTGASRWPQEGQCGTQATGPHVDGRVITDDASLNLATMRVRIPSKRLGQPALSADAVHPYHVQAVKFGLGRAAGHVALVPLHSDACLHSVASLQCSNQCRQTRARAVRGAYHHTWYGLNPTAATCFRPDVTYTCWLHCYFRGQHANGTSGPALVQPATSVCGP